MNSASISNLSIPKNSNCIYANIRERELLDPYIKNIKNCPLEYVSDIKPDFIVGSSACALVSSISYHNIHPHYINGRMRTIGADYTVRVLIIYVNVENDLEALSQLNKLCFTNSFTLILGWSHFEVGRYLETFKLYETKPPTAIQERTEAGFAPTLSRVLTSVRSINKTDVGSLMSTFDTFQGICNAEEHLLVLCPGIGPKKAKRLYQALHQPLHKKRKHLPDDG
jgi:DNA excision repair protein ERCC-1